MSCKMLKNLGLIVIDYLQLMHSGSGKCENRNQEIGKISRDIKKLATDLNVPILCLSQLNRVSSDNQKPSPSEIRDSGEVEQNCNKLMLMWCVSKNEGSNPLKTCAYGQSPAIFISLPFKPGSSKPYLLPAISVSSEATI